MSSIAGIDPNDIASMEVLKDAASAAIYGAEAGKDVYKRQNMSLLPNLRSSIILT